MSKKVSETTNQSQDVSRKPGPLPPGGEEAWNRYMEYLFGAPPSSYQATIEGRTFDILPTGTIYENGKDTGYKVQGQDVISPDGQSIAKVDLSAGKITGLNGVDVPLVEIKQPTYLSQALRGANDYRAREAELYQGALRENIKPVSSAMDSVTAAEKGAEKAIDVAKARPIKFYWGGKPVGNIMMQGGINAERQRMDMRSNLVNQEQQRLANNMLAPAAKYDFAQKQTPYDPYMKSLGVVGDAAMKMQGLAYGLPGYSQSVTATNTAKVPEPSPQSQMSSWIDLISSAPKAIKGISNTWDAATDVYDSVTNSDWWKNLWS